MRVLRDFHRPGVWIALWGAMLAIVASGSLMPAGGVPRLPIPHFDKVQHVVGYAWLASGAAMLFAHRRAYVLAGLGLLLYGAAIEWAQSRFTVDRAADAGDLLANAVGVAAGLALARTRLAGLWQRCDRRWFGR